MSPVPPRNSHSDPVMYNDSLQEIKNEDQK